MTIEFRQPTDEEQALIDANRADPGSNNVADYEQHGKHDYLALCVFKVAGVGLVLGGSDMGGGFDESVVVNGDENKPMGIIAAAVEAVAAGDCL